MKVTRDVIMDLLPLYLADEASADSRALVVEFLAQDTELAARIRTAPQELFPDTAPLSLPPDLEVRALRRARTLINLQKWLFGPAIALTALSLAVVMNFTDGHIKNVHLLITDYPLPIGAAAVLAAACWIAYSWLRRRLRLGG
jgi:hypothetical protein